jgi:predicted RecB family nuclease
MGLEFPRLSENADGPRDEEARRVSKTDVMAYIRCPYAWSQIDQGLISPEDVLGPTRHDLSEGSTIFSGAVHIGPDPAPTANELRDLFAADVKLLGLPKLENPRLEICGAPDGVDTASGELRPIEFKPHKDLRRSDELELAFDWLLLDAYRKERVAQASGVVVLRRNGAAVPVHVRLAASRLRDVRSLMRQIRKARRVGVSPRVCGCPACSEPLRDHINELTGGLKDLKLLFGIGPKRAVALEAAGINSYHDLAICDPRALEEELRGSGAAFSCAQLEQLQFHAQSYEEGRPILFGPPPSLDEAFIALDLEYHTFRPQVWLIGLYVVEGDRREHFVLWADRPDRERENLEELNAVLRENAGLPVLTWSGRSADLPELRKAARRLEVGGPLTELEGRHVDLFDYARRTLRLPIPELGLTEVAAFFGVPRTSEVRGGLKAQILYDAYRSSSSSLHMAKIKDELIAYNQDDLETLADVLRAVRELGVQDAQLTCV